MGMSSLYYTNLPADQMKLPRKSTSISNVYKVFQPVKFYVSANTSIGDTEEIVEIDDFKGISLQHGITGVFDIEEFVGILQLEKLGNVAVIAIPPSLNYVDYMVITTGKSPKQMTAVAEFIRRIFKKRSPSSVPPVLEGKNNKDWIALDLGNMALHIFSSKARKMYDLETLWTCGAAFDDLSHEEEDAFTALLREHTFPSQKA
uniref:Mitochondrial assembly of ribosomal large subunit protein 1 n=1 Tax=Ceriodaphnia reticulata TaxID=302197 RepID=A0A4Y7M078_9CRUS|nr:EOG090X0AI9 [Ceriodaphnia reticulata]